MRFIFHHASHVFYFYFSPSNIFNKVSELVRSRELLEKLKSMKKKIRYSTRETTYEKKKRKLFIQDMRNSKKVMIRRRQQPSEPNLEKKCLARELWQQPQEEKNG